MDRCRYVGCFQLCEGKAYCDPEHERKQLMVQAIKRSRPDKEIHAKSGWRWTKDEENQLRDKALTSTQLAKLLNRSFDAVRSKRDELDKLN